MATVLDTVTPLDGIEVSRLDQCERAIEAGLASFIEVGSALLTIHDGKLYRASHRTFEAYCQDRWGMARQTAYQLLDAAGVVGDLSAMADTAVLPLPVPMPTAERQVRPLARLDSGQRREAWAAAVDEARGNIPTARQVEEAAERVAPKASRPRRKPEAKDRPETPPPPPPKPVPPAPVVEVPSRTAEDQAWLESFPLRSEVVAPRFDEDALAYRLVVPAMDRLKATLAEHLGPRNAARMGHIQRALLGLQSMPPPNSWRRCQACSGASVVVGKGQCPRCRGCGYTIPEL